LTPAQNSIKWILESEEVSTVVPGMNNHEELEENIEAITAKEEPSVNVLQKHLEVSQSPAARDILAKMLTDQAIDIRFFAKRALKQLEGR
jgi:aryl-alcohol dehydrogenase-like predicted oxidoreductase